MSTVTQRKKNWWVIWVLIGLIVAAIAIVAVLAMIEVIDLAPVEAFLLSIPMWESMSIINFGIGTFAAVLIGVAFAYLYYNYLRGQQVKNVVTGAASGYNPIPSTPSSTQKDTETVIS